MKKENPQTPFTLINRFDKLSEFKDYISNLQYKIIKTNKKVDYINLPCVVDIEVSSFYDNSNEKVGLPYAFTFGINGHSVLGRTKDDLLNLLSFIIDVFHLSKENRMIFRSVASKRTKKVKPKNKQQLRSLVFYVLKGMLLFYFP